MQENARECNEVSLDFTNCVAAFSHIIGKKLLEHFQTMLEPYALEYRQAGVLWHCYESPQTQTQIAAMGEMNQNYARIFVDRLEQMGLVQRVQNPKNRREKLICLTQKGKEVAVQTYQLHLQSQEIVLADYFSHEESLALQKLCNVFMTTFLSKHKERICQ